MKAAIYGLFLFLCKIKQYNCNIPALTESEENDKMPQ
jgi:hypothetical protein